MLLLLCDDSALFPSETQQHSFDLKCAEYFQQLLPSLPSLPVSSFFSSSVSSAEELLQLFVPSSLPPSPTIRLVQTFSAKIVKHLRSSFLLLLRAPLELLLLGALRALLPPLQKVFPSLSLFLWKIRDGP